MRSDRPRTIRNSRCGSLAAAVRNALLSFLFPDACVCCGAALEAARKHLCPACEDGLRATGGVIELPGSGDAESPGGACVRAFYALEFQGATRAVLHELKYRGRTAMADDLAAVAVEAALRACDGRPDVVTPVPLHPTRLRERGFNQSELLADGLAALMGVSSRATLRRVRHTPPQARMPRRQRLAIRPSVFRATGDASTLGRVLLVDDVVTTGATLAAASRVLLGAGAEAVVCFALAGDRAQDPLAAALTESG